MWTTATRRLWRSALAIPTCSAVRRCTRTYHSRSPVYGHKPMEAATFTLDPKILDSRARHPNLHRLASAYREHGHRSARLDPLALATTTSDLPELKPETYGLSTGDATVYELSGIVNAGKEAATVSETRDLLAATYCGSVGFEFRHLESTKEREWFANRAEEMATTGYLTDESRKALAKEMLKSQVFDNFLASKFATVKRYGCEGAESMMAFFVEVFSKSAQYEYEQVILGMPHRGRLNLLTGLLRFPPTQLFRKMKGFSEFPEDLLASGDVISHLTSSIGIDVGDRKLHVTMLPNPSHLEAVNPVIVGKVRGRQMSLEEGSYSSTTSSSPGDKVLCIQIHGDAAFEAQGIVMETLALANVPHFTVGGSVHLVVNNQLGFTTPAERGRSSLYCSDLAKMIWAPVIHVNGDHPEDVVKATALAMEYRELFRKDVFVDLVCFRRWGHNELDDPTFTNPIMYEAIHARSSVPDKYAEELVTRGIMSREEIAETVAEHTRFLSGGFQNLETARPQANYLGGYWRDLKFASPNITTWDTGVHANVLRYVGAKSIEVPPGFSFHPHLDKTFMQTRLTRMKEGINIDWATAEALAIGSLLYQGFDVRLSGQDVGRGTFSHRHVVFVDQKTGDTIVPLNHIFKDQEGFLEVAQSILSEEAVLGFEYGMSIENPNRLVIWEAQFGDFFNGAQIIIDTFIASGETKWALQSGLVMLLPHGYDGAGPEHSSCRIERFLQQCDSKEDGVDGDNINMQIANPTTPAQYFHLLRRQVARNYRKPLILVAPKTLLRYPGATSTLEDLLPGKTFRPVLVDPPSSSADDVKRILFCSGKHFYALQKQREALNRKDVAIVRLEALCPFPAKELQDVMKTFSRASTIIWSQEEHQNMGAWTFVAPRFENVIGCKPKYVGRGPLATPAVGIASIHQKEAEAIVSSPFA